MATDAELVEKAFLAFYTSHQNGGGGVGGAVQYGGLLPVFRGAPTYYRQNGAGFGQILRTIGKWVLPVLFKSGVAAVSNFSKARDEGKSVKQSLKDSIAPTAEVAFQSGAEQVGKYHRAKQTGGRRGRSGKRKRKHVTKVYKPKKRMRIQKMFADKPLVHKGIKYNF